MNLSIENGKVAINGELVKKNIQVENGSITKITDEPCHGEKIDASGKIVLPGLIDIHVHLREPGFESKEDIATGTRAAAAGGITTVFEMPNTNPPTTTLKLVQKKRELMREKATVNYGIYMGATLDNLEEIKKARNVPGVKLYMGSSTGDLLLTDREAIKNLFTSGKKIVVHAEDEELMKKNAEKHESEPEPHVHSLIRNDEAEASAVRTALELTKTPNQLHFTHVSSRKALNIIKKTSSTCDATPHHLFLTSEELKKTRQPCKNEPIS